MKLDMMVVGITCITDELMEVQLQPLVTQRKKLTVGEIAGDIDRDAKELIDAMLQQGREYRTKLYLSRQWCSDNNIIPFRHVTLDIDLGDLAKQRLGT